MKPNSFSTICTSNCAHELVGLLLSLSVFHTNEKIYIISDTKTKEIIDQMTPKPRLQIFWYIELDKYDNMNRAVMEQNGLFGEFLTFKMKAMNYALVENSDTLLLDTDIIITDTINDIDETKELGLSPQFIKQEYIDKTGFYNAGMLWTNNKSVPNTWCENINFTHHCPEQINMVELTKKYDYFEFGENYNLQCWRLYLSPDSPDKIASVITSQPNDKVYYKDKPLKFIHTHFLDKRFESFNNLLIEHFKNVKAYKILAIIYRVINNKWILRIPKQPLQGLGNHKNDSYREMPILLKINNKDVDVTFDVNTIHCWLEPNIITYDRPTLEWCNQEIVESSLLLLGNGDIKVEGEQLKQHIPNINIKPWIFWPRKPMLMEKILKIHNILPFEKREIESIFIGNFENSVQEKYRNTNITWENVLEEYHCIKGSQHKFNHEEYLMKMRNSKYGLCLRGYGSKCHREVELMAFGTIPIVTHGVTVDSYMEPLIENTHYIKVNSPEEIKEKINSINEKKWNVMSSACYEWYQRNVHSKSAWNNMISHILYNFDTNKEKIIFWGASVTAQPNGYVDKITHYLQNYNIVKCAYGGMHLKDAGCFFVDDIINKSPKYCIIDFLGTGYMEANENTQMYLHNIFLKFYEKNIKIIFLILPRKDDENNIDKRKKFLEICISECSKYNRPIIDLRNLLSSYNHDDLMKDVVHTNNNGAEIFAKTISNEFLKIVNDIDYDKKIISIEKTKYYNIKKINCDKIYYDRMIFEGNGEIFGIYQNIGPYSPYVDIIHNGTFEKCEEVWDKHCSYERQHVNLSNIIVNGITTIQINENIINYELCDNKNIKWNTYKKCIKPITIYYNGNISISN